MTQKLHIIGGGLAGSEAAWQAGESGLEVVLHEMRPSRATFAHQTDSLAELVCSNSFRSDDWEGNAVGLLHAEIARALGVSTRQVERLLASARSRTGTATTSQLVAALVTDELAP